ncbi:MAG: KGK family protein [Cyanobacteria bacterium J06592_8]
MNYTTNILNNDDVLHTGASALMFQCTFKVSEFLAMMQAKLEEEEIFSDGLECELLSPGLPWQQGKVKVRLEFTGSATSATSATAVAQVPMQAPMAVPQYSLIPTTNATTVSVEELPPPLRRQMSPVGMWS